MTNITVLSPAVIQQLSRRLAVLESAYIARLGEYRTPFLEEKEVRIGKTVANGETYPAGNPSGRNTFWVEFGAGSYDNTAIGAQAFNWTATSPAEIKRCRTLCGGWVEENAYVGLQLINDRWWITEVPMFYYGRSVGTISAGSDVSLGTGLVAVKVNGTTENLAVSNYSSAIANNKKCYVWRMGSKFMVAEICE